MPVNTAKSRRSLLAAHSLLVYLFLYAPIVILIVYSFNDSRQSAIWGGFSGRWYGVLLNDYAMRDAAINSLIVAVAATILSTLIGTLAAIGIARFRFRGKGITKGMIYLPMVIPEVVLAVSLLTLFSSLEMDLSLNTVILAHVVFTVSYVAVVVKARLAGLDQSIEEAAMDLGAGPIGAFVRVTLPRLLPGIIAAALLAFTLSLDDYVVTSLVSEVNSQTLPIKIYSMLKPGVSPEANAACTLLLLVTVVMVIAAQWLLARR